MLDLGNGLSITLKFEEPTAWISKRMSVILVEKEEDIDALWHILKGQDFYWNSYKELIRVAPDGPISMATLHGMCRYCGKTDIWDIEEVKSKVPFIFYQFDEV